MVTARLVGRIVPEKAPHLAIEAARRAGMPLALAGPVSDLAVLRRRPSDPASVADVEYAGHLRVPDLAALVGSRAAALVTPVWDEPYGLVVAEALACGTPVVAFDRGGIPEVLADSVGRSPRRPGDVQAMADATSAVVGLDRVAGPVVRRALSVAGPDGHEVRTAYPGCGQGATWEATGPRIRPSAAKASSHPPIGKNSPTASWNRLLLSTMSAR